MITEAEVGVLMRSIGKHFRPLLADLRQRADTTVDLVADLDMRMMEVERRLAALESAK